MGESDQAAKVPEQWDLFISYARDDNKSGWISAFVDALVGQHATFAGERRLRVFFDKQSIGGLHDWRLRILEGITHSHVFVAFISPGYFASEWCRREWRTWIDHEIAAHTLSGSAAPIYIVEVPGLADKPMLDEHAVAKKVAELCSLPQDMLAETATVVRQMRQRQINTVRPFYNAGLEALQKADLTKVLDKLAHEVDDACQLAEIGGRSVNTVPRYNRYFSGRVEELLDLRQKLQDNRAGVITGIHGLGGVGKTELAFTYAHAFAGVYPGGRFLIPCEHQTGLRQAVLKMGDFFGPAISEEERKTSDRYFPAVVRCLRERIESKGAILLVLDNVNSPDLLSREQTNHLTVIGPKLHLLATTRLPPDEEAGGIKWLTLGELPEDDALAILEKHRAFTGEAEQQAARQIVRRLGGFAMAVELVGAYLAAPIHSSVTYAAFRDVHLAELDEVAADPKTKLVRHNHEKRLHAVLLPTLQSLSPAGRRAMDYAALLPADLVALPWLKALVSADYPEVARPAQGIGESAWDGLLDELWSLALLVRRREDGVRDGDWPQQTTDSAGRVVRVHRLVQELVRKECGATALAERQAAVDQFIIQRATVLEKETHWQEIRWELQPMQGVAELWADTGHEPASWLCDCVGNRWHALAEWSLAESLIERALAIGEKSCGPEHPNVATYLNNLARLLQETNRLSEAEPLIKRTLAIFEKCYGPEHPKVATALSNLAQFLRATNRLSEAESLMKRALAIDEKSHGPEHPKSATVLNNLAGLLQDTNRLSEAEPLMKRVVTIFEKSCGPDHPNVATALSNLAQLLQDTNRLSEAEPLIKRALAIDEKCYGLEHPDVAIGLNNLAQLLVATNRLSEAEPLIERALAIFEKCNGPEHPKVAGALNNLVALYYATNRLSEAEPLIKRALAIAEKNYGPEHPDVAIALNNLVAMYYATNRLSEAEPLIKRALAIDEKSHGPEHPDVAIGLNNLAQLLVATNRLSEAEPLMKWALHICLESLGIQHPNTQTLLNNYASLLQAMGQSPDQVRNALRDLCQPYGIDLGNAGGQSGIRPSPRLQAVIEELMRDPSKVNEIAAKLQREDPALLAEMVQWIQHQQ